MTHKWIEVTIRLIDENDTDMDVEVYAQRINYRYFQHVKPQMVAEIAAIVNDLRMPEDKMPLATSDQLFGFAGSDVDTNAEFEKEYAIHKPNT